MNHWFCIFNVRFSRNLKIKLGLYSCPIHVLSCTKHIISGPLAHITNVFVQGVFFSFEAEKKSKSYTRFIRMTMNLTLVIIDQFHYCPSLVECIIVLLEPTIVDKSCWHMKITNILLWCKSCYLPSLKVVSPSPSFQ